MLTISAAELSTEGLLRLLGDAGIEASAGEDAGDSYVEASVDDITFILEPYAEAQVVRAWTAMDLEPGTYTREAVLEDVNRFNANFLVVRNFIVQGPHGEDSVRVVWDHDQVVGAEGLSSDALATLLSRMAKVIGQAFQSAEGPGAEGPEGGETTEA